MFKLRSMSGFIVICTGGPIAWSSVRQERTSRSSCKAEVRATDECAKEVLSLRMRGTDIGLTDSLKPSNIFNDNQGCINGGKTTMTTGMKHLNLRDNAVRESVHASKHHQSHCGSHQLCRYIHKRTERRFTFLSLMGLIHASRVSPR